MTDATADYILTEGSLIVSQYTETHTPEALRADARRWLDSVREQTDEFPTAHAVKLIPICNILNRIAYGTDADSNLTNRLFLKAFSARIHGDESVQESDLYIAISEGLRRRDPLYLTKPLQWSVRTLSEWFSAVRFRGRFIGLPAAEARRRTSLLLTEDLSAFTPNPAALKRRLSSSL